jgi:hypothetical protein
MQRDRALDSGNSLPSEFQPLLIHAPVQPSGSTYFSLGNVKSFDLIAVSSERDYDLSLLARFFQRLLCCLADFTAPLFGIRPR